MKHTIGKKERERNQKMNLDDFIDANIDQITIDYLEDNPEDGHKIDDGDIDCVWDWVNNDPGYYTEIMIEIYLNNIVL